MSDKRSEAILRQLDEAFRTEYDSDFRILGRVCRENHLPALLAEREKLNNAVNEGHAREDALTKEVENLKAGYLRELTTSNALRSALKWALSEVKRHPFNMASYDAALAALEEDHG